MRVRFAAVLTATFVALAGMASGDIAKPATIEDTLDLMLEILLPDFPEARINRSERNIDIGPDNGIMNPDNIHAVLQKIEGGAEREVALDQFMASLVASLTEPAPDLAAIPLERVYPVVRHRSFADNDGGLGLYFEPFVGDMIKVIAIDYPDRVAYVSIENLQESGITLEALWQAAMQNLLVKREAAQYSGNEVTFMIMLDGFYESSLVFDDALWRSVRADFDDDIVMIVPTRDVIIVTKASAPEEVEFLDELRADMLANGTHQLSDFMYIRRNDRWQVYPR